MRGYNSKGFFNTKHKTLHYTQYTQRDIILCLLSSVSSLLFHALFLSPHSVADKGEEAASEEIFCYLYLFCQPSYQLYTRLSLKSQPESNITDWSVANVLQTFWGGRILVFSVPSFHWCRGKTVNGSTLKASKISKKSWLYSEEWHLRFFLFLVLTGTRIYPRM